MGYACGQGPLNLILKMGGGTNGNKVMLSYRATSMMCYKMVVRHASYKMISLWHMSLAILFLASKFSLPPTIHIVRGTYATYELSNESISVIMDILEDTQLLE
jgi:hypothetical protein